MKIILAPGDSITGVLSGAATTTNPVAHVDANDKSESVSLSGATGTAVIGCLAALSLRTTVSR